LLTRHPILIITIKLVRSTSSQIILRGTRSAGYAFVAFKSETAAKKAADELDKQELDGRPVQVQIAKAASEKEPRPKRVKKPKSRRSDSKAPPGEVTEAEANGEVAADGAAAGADEVAKPKNKKKKAVSHSAFSLIDLG
jgi:RNA recognition motif-containing protein